MPSPTTPDDSGTFVPDEAARLLHGALDGELTQGELERFEKLRSQDPEIAKEYDDLASLDVALNSISVVPPPSDLKDRILSNLPPRHQHYRITDSIVLTAPKRSLMDRIAALVLARPAMALAYTLVIGLVGGAALFGVLSEGGADVRSAAGTMGAFGDPVAEETIGVAGARATIAVFETTDDQDDVRTVGITVPEAPADDIQLVLEFDPDEVQFVSFNAIEGPARVSSDTHKALVWLVSGTEGQYRLTFRLRQEGSGLGASLIRHDTVVAQREIAL